MLLGLLQALPVPSTRAGRHGALIHRFPIRDRRQMVEKIDNDRRSRVHGDPSRAFDSSASRWISRVGTRQTFLLSARRGGAPHASDALGGIDVYIGDGATIRRTMVRKRDGRLIGHTSVVAQLGWCKQAAVHWAVFTHCGSPIVRGNAGKMHAALWRLGREHGVEACFACDGDRLTFLDGDGSRWTKHA